MSVPPTRAQSATTPVPSAQLHPTRPATTRVRTDETYKQQQQLVHIPLPPPKSPSVGASDSHPLKAYHDGGTVKNVSGVNNGHHVKPDLRSDIGSRILDDHIDVSTGKLVPSYVQEELRTMREQISRLVIRLKSSESAVQSLKNVNDQLRQKNSVLETFSRVTTAGGQFGATMVSFREDGSPSSSVPTPRQVDSAHNTETPMSAPSSGMPSFVSPHKMSGSMLLQPVSATRARRTSVTAASPLRPQSAVSTSEERRVALPSLLVAQNEELLQHLQDIEEDGRVESQGHAYELAHLEARLDQTRAEKDAFANQTSELNRRIADEVLLKRQTVRLENAIDKFKSSRKVRMSSLARMQAVERLAMEAHDDLLTLKRTQGTGEVPVGEACLVVMDLIGLPTMATEFPALIPFVLKTYHSTLLEQCRKFGGYEIQIRDDVGFFSFHQVHSALQFASGVHTDMLSHQYPEALVHHQDFNRIPSPNDASITLYLGPRVRTGLYFCSPSTEFDNHSGRFRYFGREVAHVGLITAHTMPGEVRLSFSTWTRLQHEMATLKLTPELLGVHIDKVKSTSSTTGSGTKEASSDQSYAATPSLLVDRRRLWSHDRILNHHSSLAALEERQSKLHSPFWQKVTHLSMPVICVAPKLAKKDREAAPKLKPQHKPATQLQKEAVSLLGAGAFDEESPTKSVATSHKDSKNAARDSSTTKETNVRDSTESGDSLTGANPIRRAPGGKQVVPGAAAGNLTARSSVKDAARIKQLEEQLAVQTFEAKKWKKKFVRHYSLSRLAQHSLQRQEREHLASHDNLLLALQKPPVPKRVLTLAGLSLVANNSIAMSQFSPEALNNSIGPLMADLQLTMTPPAIASGKKATQLTSPSKLTTMKAAVSPTTTNPTAPVLPQLEAEHPITIIAITVPPTGGALAALTSASQAGFRVPPPLDPGVLDHGLTSADHQCVSFMSEGLLQALLSVVREKAMNFGLYEVKQYKDMLLFVVNHTGQAVQFASHLHESLLDVGWNEAAQQELDAMEMAPVPLAEASGFAASVKNNSGRPSVTGVVEPHKKNSNATASLPLSPLSPVKPDHAPRVLLNIFNGPRVAISIDIGSPEVIENTITGRMDYIGAPIRKTLAGLRCARGGETVVSDTVLAVLKKESKFLPEWAVVGKVAAAPTAGGGTAMPQTSMPIHAPGSGSASFSRWSSLLPHCLAPRFKWYASHHPNAADEVVLRERLIIYLEHFHKLRWQGVGGKLSAPQIKDLHQSVQYRRLLRKQQLQQERSETAMMLLHDKAALVDRTPPPVVAPAPVWPALGLRPESPTSGSPMVSGYCTIVVHDIEGSRTLFEDLGDTFVKAQEIHNAICLNAMKRNQGYLVRHNGYDSFMVAFASVADAVNYSVQCQQILLNVDWPAEFAKQEVSLRVRDSKTGMLLFNGPRTRYSIVYALFPRTLEGVPGHPETKNTDFVGPHIVQCLKQWRQCPGGDVRLNSEAMSKYQRLCDEAGSSHGCGAVLKQLHITRKFDHTGVLLFVSLLPKSLQGRATKFPLPKPVKTGTGKETFDYGTGATVGNTKSSGGAGPGSNTWWKGLWSLTQPVKVQPMYPVKRPKVPAKGDVDVKTSSTAQGINVSTPAVESKALGKVKKAGPSGAKGSKASPPGRSSPTTRSSSQPKPKKKV